MKKIFAFMAIATLMSSCCQSPEIESSVPAKMVNGTVVLETPARAEGQTSALQMACEPIDTVRVGFVGLGGRGYSAVGRYLQVPGTKITAICDKYPEKVSAAQEMLKENGFPKAAEYTGDEGYKQLCEDPNVDLVYICTPWLLHTPIAVYAMEHGKHAATEVPAATTIEECWQLVNTCERTRKHCMMLENCCYDFFEMTCLNMAQQGVFGEIYHAEGAYLHNLDPFWPHYEDNWRLDFNQKHRGDNYPTHGLGPICQILDIHRGDKMDYLVAMDSDSYRGAARGKEFMGTDEFEDGDHTVSLIRTHNGHQIEIQHNVYAPRPYSRIFQLTGTNGYACKYPEPVFAVEPDPENFADKETFDALCKLYEHPISAEYEEKAKEVGGHGGMDYIMDCRLIHCLRNGLPLDEDVYDAAEWSCIAELSRISIKNGSVPVQVPDFTRGDWNEIQGFHHSGF
ncbi:MAG: Gfo/Idh/MocA family oxidoreductase [Bacteroidales bacterium]|nr:Gfo/Idh/MocA family oxidoreductase [Bacteroidales bacterium]